MPAIQKVTISGQGRGAGALFGDRASLKVHTKEAYHAIESSPSTWSRPRARAGTARSRHEQQLRHVELLARAPAGHGAKEV